MKVMNILTTKFTYGPINFIIFTVLSLDQQKNIFMLLKNMGKGQINFYFSFETL